MPVTGERHDALPRRPAIEDQLLRAAEDALHGLQINALPRHFLRLLVFVIDFQETRALALGFRDRLLLVAFGDLDDLRRAAARVRNDAVGIGLRFILQALKVGLGGLNVAKRVDHLRRRIDLLHLHLRDRDARAVAVERPLHQFLHGAFRHRPGAGKNRLDLRTADHLAHRAFRDRLHGAFRILDIEEIVGDTLRLDAPQHGEIDVDDVLVAGQHQAFFRHVAHGAAAPGRIVDQRHADRDGGDAQRLRQLHGLDRIWQMIVQPGLRIADIFTEAQHDAELLGLDPVKAGCEPDRHREQKDHHDAEAGEIAPWKKLLQAVLTAPQKVFKVGRPWSDRLWA